MATTYICPNSILATHVLRTNGLNPGLPALLAPNPHAGPGNYLYVVRSQANVAQNCSTCHALTVPVDNLIAYDYAAANRRPYQVTLHGTDDGLRYKLILTRGNIINNFILNIDPENTRTITSTTVIPPVEASWLRTNFAHADYAIRRDKNDGARSVSGATFELGFQNSNNSAGFGLVHALYKHPKMAVAGARATPAHNSTQDLSGLNSNLRAATNKAAVGDGIRRVYDANLSRVGIRGINSGISILIVISTNPAKRILTTFENAEVFGSLLNGPIERKKWH